MGGQHDELKQFNLQAVEITTRLTLTKVHDARERDLGRRQQPVRGISLGRRELEYPEFLPGSVDDYKVGLLVSRDLYSRWKIEELQCLLRCYYDGGFSHTLLYTSRRLRNLSARSSRTSIALDC